MHFFSFTAEKNYYSYNSHCDWKIRGLKIDQRSRARIRQTARASAKYDEDNMLTARAETRQFPPLVSSQRLFDVCSLIFMRVHVDVAHDLGLNGGSIGQPQDLSHNKFLIPRSPLNPE